MTELNCERHPDRPAAVICPMKRAFCGECRETTELRTGFCGYCSHKAKCPIQLLFRRRQTLKSKI